jgi:hypothetical protein
MRRLLVTANVVPSSPIIVTLNMWALSSSETSVLTRATRRTSQKTAFFTLLRLWLGTFQWTLFHYEATCPCDIGNRTLCVSEQENSWQTVTLNNLVSVMSVWGQARPSGCQGRKKTWRSHDSDCNFEQFTLSVALQLWVLVAWQQDTIHIRAKKHSYC